VSVYKRGRVWWYKFTWNGKLVRESTRQTKMRVAEELEAAHRTRLARGEAGIDTGRRRVTFFEFAETFLAFVAVRSTDRPFTIKFYKATLRRLLNYKPMADARLQDINEASRCFLSCS
jgi:hypothetical protein